MQKQRKVTGIDRIIDANINRAKEGLRVCEEITRFVIENRPLTKEFKETRHGIDTLASHLPESGEMIRSRESALDIGSSLHHAGELKRKDFRDIFFANIQRVKESIRVLEEFSKLKDKKVALRFKLLRYRIYELEKKAITKCPSLRCYR